MKVIQEISLPDFEFWSGAATNAEKLTYEQLEELESYFEDEYPDGITATELNDFMWFGFDTVKAYLGITDEDDEDEFEESCSKKESCTDEAIEYSGELEDDETYICPYCNQVIVFDTDEYICPDCGIAFDIIEVEEDIEESVDTKNDKITITEDGTKDSYMYFTKHGIGPGMLPRDVKIVDWYDVNNNITIIYVDRVLTTDELSYYDIYPETMNSKLLDRYDLEVDEVTGQVFAK